MRHLTSFYTICSPTKRSKDPLLLSTSEMNCEEVRRREKHVEMPTEAFLCPKGSWLTGGSPIPGVLCSPRKTLQEVLSTTPKNVKTAVALFTMTGKSRCCPDSLWMSRQPGLLPDRRGSMVSQNTQWAEITFIQTGVGGRSSELCSPLQEAVK